MFFAEEDFWCIPPSPAKRNIQNVWKEKLMRRVERRLRSTYAAVSITGPSFHFDVK